MVDFSNMILAISGGPPLQHSDEHRHFTSWIMVMLLLSIIKNSQTANIVQKERLQRDS
jgi:hypothetical protein